MFRITRKFYVNNLKIPKIYPELYAQQQSRFQSSENLAPTIIVEKDADITLIGINRERTRNSIDSTTSIELSNAIRDFEADNSSRVAVLHGIGGSFCAGYDIKDLAALENENYFMKREGCIGPTRRHLDKTIICALNGFCVGAGLELSLLCDLRVMEETAVLGFFNRVMGVPISDAGTVRLSKIIGYSRALDLILSGRRVGGKEAFEMGLVTRLVATGSALGQAVHLAFNIAKYPMAALKHDRNCIYSSTFDASGFRKSVQNEIMLMNNDILEEMKVGAKKFMQAERKGAKTDSFNIKEKVIPEWEQIEINIEKELAKSRSR